MLCAEECVHHLESIGHFYRPESCEHVAVCRCYKCGKIVYQPIPLEDFSLDVKMFLDKFA